MKIHILGASGAGITTLRKALSKRLGIRQFDADDYFWENTDPLHILKNVRGGKGLVNLKMIYQSLILGYFQVQL
jgi:dephospho-CoA kinase